MRILKFFLIAFSALALVLTSLSLLLPSEVMTSRWIMTAEPGDSVLAYLNQLHRWKEWNLLFDQASDIRVSTEVHQEPTGKTLHWIDRKGGKNSLRITESNPRGIVTELQMGDQEPIVSGFSVEQRQADSTQVVWFIIEKMKWYPWEKFYGMMAADLKGPLLQESLNRLKKNPGPWNSP